MHSTRHKTVLFEDADLENADLPETSADPTRPRPDRVLVAALLNGRTAAIRAALQRPVPQIIHLVAPSPAWALALNKEIKIAHDGARAVTVTETKKDRNNWLVEHLQQQLGLKVHSILCTTATPDLLPAEVLGAIDLRLELPRLDSAGVHRAPFVPFAARGQPVFCPRMSTRSIFQILSWPCARAVQRATASGASRPWATRSEWRGLRHTE